VDGASPRRAQEHRDGLSLLSGERAPLGTRRGRRALSCYRQAILVLRRFLDATRATQLACDNQISGPTAYRYLHEAIDVLAEPARARRAARGR
jgi:hypothetical protein